MRLCLAIFFLLAAGSAECLAQSTYPVVDPATGRNAYQILQIRDPLKATHEEIVAAYRKAAMANHPDRHPGDAARESEFKLCADAYKKIGKEEDRAVYDAAAGASLLDQVEAQMAFPLHHRLYSEIEDRYDPLLKGWTTQPAQLTAAAEAFVRLLAARGIAGDPLADNLYRIYTDYLPEQSFNMIGLSIAPTNIHKARFLLAALTAIRTPRARERIEAIHADSVKSLTSLDRDSMKFKRFYFETAKSARAVLDDCNVIFR